MFELFLKKNHNILLISILILTIAAFWPVGSSDFVNYDDPDYVVKNELIKNLKSDNIAYYFTHKTTDLYVPLVFVSYALDYKLFGLNPHAFHFMNLFWHILNVLLVFSLVKSMSKNLFYPFFITSLFALHPLHVESVAWVTERKDLLYSFFYLLAFFAWHKYRQKNKLSFLAVSLVCFILSCFSKPMAITFPAMILLYDLFYARLPVLKNTIRYVPFALVSLVFFYISVHFMDTSVRGSANTGYNGFDKIFVPFYGLSFYLFKICVPFNLSVIYPYAQKTRGLLPLTYLISPLLAGFMFWLVFFFKRSSPEVKAGFLVFILSLLPVLQLIPNNYTVAADRYVYLPCLGLFFIIAALAKRLMEQKKLKGSTFKLIVTIVILVFAYSTYARTKVWKDSITLFSDVIEKYDNSDIAFHNRAIAYNREGKFNLALNDLEKALQLDPKNADAWSNYGWTLSATGKYDEAIAALNKAIQLKPTLARAHNDLENTYGMTGRFDLALKHLLTADSLSPGNPTFYNNIAFTYQKMGATPKAIGYYQKAARLGLKEAQELLLRNNLTW